MNVIITINTGTDAFVPSTPLGVARFLTEVAKIIRYHEELHSFPLRDMKGNKVGTIDVVDTCNY